MGPYSQVRQAHRRNIILQILAGSRLSNDARRIWTQHLYNLATGEQQYNARVAEVYSNLGLGTNHDSH